MASIRFESRLDRVVVDIAPAGAAGAVVVPWAGLRLTLDLADAGRLVEVTAPGRDDGSPPLAALTRLLGRDDLPAVGDETQSIGVELPTGDARLLLAKLAVGTLGRGDGDAWEVELAWLARELERALGLIPTGEVPDLRRWLASIADEGTLLADHEPAVGAGPGPLEIVGDLAVAAGHLEARDFVAEARAGRAPGVEGAVPLLLTEHRARATPSRWRWEADALVGDPVGPAGSFGVGIGSLHVEADMAEPTRIVRATGFDPAPADPDRAASIVVQRLRPVLVLRRDIELLGERDLGRPRSLAQAELAVRLAECRWPGAAELAVPAAERAVTELSQAWGPAIGDLPEHHQALIERLGDLVDVDGLPSTPDDRAELPTFRGGFGPDMSARVLDPTDLDDLLRDLGTSPIDLDTGLVRLSEPARLAMASEGEAPYLRVIVGPGPTAMLDVSLSDSRPRTLRFRLLRDLELVGEVTLRVAGSQLIEVPVAGASDSVDVELVHEGRDVDAMVAGRAALLAELAGGDDAVGRWLDVADRWADLLEPDRAAIAVERAALAVPGDTGWRTIRRSVVLGTAWANGRARPPAGFTPRWRTPVDPLDPDDS